MFKRSGRGHSKGFCENPECVNFVPEDQRGYKKKSAAPAEGAENADAVPAVETAAEESAKPAAKKTAAKKTAAAKKPAAANKTTTAKKTTAKKTTKKDTKEE